MTNKHLTFAIFGNSFQPRKSHSLLRVLAFLRKHGAKAIFDRPFYDFLTEEQSVDLGEVGSRVTISTPTMWCRWVATALS